jgi:hypothetical protein
MHRLTTQARQANDRPQAMAARVVMAVLPLRLSHRWDSIHFLTWGYPVGADDEPDIEADSIADQVVAWRPGLVREGGK